MTQRRWTGTKPDNRKRPGSAGCRAGDIQRKEIDMPRLCISRIPGESVLIGDNVTVYVHAIRRGRVFLAGEGPAEIAVDRSEVRARKLRHTDRERDVMAGLMRGEPLYRLEQRMDLADNACRPSEADMITAQRARAATLLVETLQRSIEYLRGENAKQLADIERLMRENAKLRAKLQDKEHVE